MDMLRLASPWVLLGILPAWAVILHAALASARRRPGAVGRACLGCLTAGLLLLALSGPSLRTSRRGVCPVCIVLDVSPSMKVGRAGEDATPVTQWAAALPPGQVGLAAFTSAGTMAVPPLSRRAYELGRPAASPGSALRDLAKDGAAETDVAAGLRYAAAALPDAQGILLLHSDARETRGDAVAAASALAAAGIQTHAIAADVRPRDIGVVSLVPASEPAPGQPVRLRVGLATTADTAVTVHLRRLPADGVPAASWSRQATPAAGAATTLLFEDSDLPEGLYQYEVHVSADADECPQNDRASCLVRVGGHRRVVYVSSGPEPGPLAALLRRLAPAAASLRSCRPEEVAGAAQASVIILDNVSAWALGERAAAGLARQVTEGGAGLLAIGGDAAFAAGGYGDSPLETVLPVSSRAAQRPALELVLVVDSSGSMNEQADQVQKLALAKQAVLSLRPAMAASDRLGIIAFAAEPRTVSPLASLGAWDDLRGRLLGLQAGGGTRITPAVEAAANLFPPPSEASDAVRHILLLSDGRSQDFDLPRLVRLCRDSRLSVSAVATGPDADREGLARLASDTGGRLYASGDLARLAETFLKDMAWARGEGLREGARPVQWGRPEPIWTAPGGALPDVPALNATRAKDGADVHWSAVPRDAGQDASPLLATWRRGVGKAAAMPWPVDAASGEWLDGPAAEPRFAPLLAWLSSAPRPTDWTARLIGRDGRWWVRVEETVEAVGRPSTPFLAAVLDPASPEAETVTLDHVSPGVHEARLEARPWQPAEVAVHRRDGGEVARLSLPGLPPLEYARLGLDRARLDAIVRAGGGQIHETPESLVEAVRRKEVRGYEPMGVVLVWAAAGLVLVQAVLRVLGRL